MKSINSHHIQKSLIKRIFPKGIREINMHTMRSHKKYASQVASSSSLFQGDQGYVKWIEGYMNNNLESRFIKITNNLDMSGGSIDITFEEAFIIRKYYLITWIRMNLQNMSVHSKLKMQKFIENWTVTKYRKKYEGDLLKSEPLLHFFVNGTFIKFIRHDNHIFINDKDLFISIPFDKSKTDLNFFKENNVKLPGYIAPFNKNISIVFMIPVYYEQIFKSYLSGKQLKFQMNLSAEATTQLLMPDGETIDPNGKIESAIKITPEDEYLKIDKSNNIKKLSERDRLQWKYRYKIHEWKKEDWNIFLIHSINEYESVTNLHKIDINHSYIFEDSNLFKNFLKEIIATEEYVGYNNPDNMDYWKNELYNHKIWEILLPSTIKSIKKIIDKI